MIEWAEAEIEVPSGPFEGFPYSVDRLPYARLLLGQLGKWARHVITGPTQSGKSFHAFVLVILYYLFELEESVIVGLPSMNMASEKWTEDIKPAIEKSSYANMLPDTGQGSKGAGKLWKINFKNGRFIRFMSSGGGDKQRAGATAKILIITETDGLDIAAESSQEGQTKIQQLEGRVRAHGEDARKFFECTVSAEDAFTWQQYNAGSASKIVHPCRACGNWVSPEKEHLVGWEEANNEIDAGELGRFSCPKCGILYSEEDRLEMNLRAKLIHRGQTINADGEITGDLPKTNTLGFRWSAFQNLLSPTRLLATEEWTAKHSPEPELAEVARKQQAWAMPADNPNIEKVPLSVGIIRGSEPKFEGRCSGLDPGVVPESTEILTAFIDCHKRFLQWSIEAKAEKRIHVVDYGVHETASPDLVGEEPAIYDAIIELANQLEDRFSGLNVGLVDSGNWPETIFRAVRKLSSIWRASHGVPSYVHPFKRSNTKKIPVDGNRHWHLSKNGRMWVVNFNPDTLKHRVHSGFLIHPFDAEGNRVSGSITLPGDKPDDHTIFAKQVVAEEWITEFVKGKGTKTFWKKNDRDNHLLDCCVGNMVARYVVASARYSAAPAPPQTAGQVQEETKGFIRKPGGKSGKGGFIRRRS